MSKSLLMTTVTLLVAAPLAAQDAPGTPPDTGAWQVYSGTGEPASLDRVLAEAAAADVVFLGESHNDIVGHRLQFEILNRLLESHPAGSAQIVESHPTRPRILSLEMFERDVQYIVDEYLAGLISGDQFRRSARPWAYYDEDYAPVLERAKEAGLPVIAANAPRRYVNIVSRTGPAALEALSAEAKRYLPPLPYAPPSEAYRAELHAIMGEHGDSTGPPIGENTFHAQALWDATMAWSIAEALLRHPGAQVIHLVGSFHVKNGTGTPEQLERYRPGTRTLIVYVDPVEDVNTFPAELAGAGDFVILTDKAKVRADQRTGSTGQD